jgi:hypothetical protein
MLSRHTLPHDAHDDTKLTMVRRGVFFVFIESSCSS